MTFTMTAVVASKVGFASHQNAVPILRELHISSATDQHADTLRITLRADPPFLQPRTWLIDRLGANDSLQITDRDIALDAGLLGDLTESISGTVILVLHTAEGLELASSRHEVELLARNEWGGAAGMAELLPAFVMPNDPAVDRVLKAASEVLRRAGRSDAIDGYRSGRRDRVWEIASAIWSAVAGLRLSYALPPASFERMGQKIRTPGNILDGGVATCLDSTLLFAAAIEQAGLNPLLVLTEGHAFVGLWLQPIEFATLVTEEAAALRRRLDLDDLLVFESTLVTQNPPASFGVAVTAGRRQMSEEATTKFSMAIDVRRARMQKIRPLGLALGPREPGGDVPEPLVAEGLEAAPALPAFDVEVEAVVNGPMDRIQQWQRKLLNLTTSNRLLHLPDSAKAVRLLCPDPSGLEDLLAAGKKVRLVAMPELDVGGRDVKLYEEQTQLSLREEVARAAMDRGEAMSLLTKDKLDAALIELYRKARSDLEEGGANTLYLALGFLKWKKAPGDERSYRAPLILQPVKLERKSALSGVVMVHHEDEPRFNLTLLELLRQDFELNIPGLEGELPKDASGVDVAGVWRIVRAAVRDLPGFELVPEVVLGTFSFAKYLMWKDLVDRADRLKESPLVRHLIERDGASLAEHGAFPRAEELDAKVDPAELFTLLPADSSQLTAVIASAEGRNFVLDGPPGTGKSQTIANMIAHNLALGRRVLFVAEKKAALDVVQRRLAEKGLAPFCLELHSAKATKTEVLKQLDRAWTTRDTLTADEWRREASEAKRLRDGLNEVVRLLHRMEPNGWTVHRAIGRTVRDAGVATPKLLFAPGTRHNAADMTRYADAARRLGLARAEVADLPAILDGVARTEWSNGWQEAVVTAAQQVPPALDRLAQAGAKLLAATGLPLPAADRQALERLMAFATLLLETHGHDMRFAFAPDMAARMDAARQAMALVARYRAEVLGLSAQYPEAAIRRIDIDGSRAAWGEAGKKFWFFATFARRKAAQALAHAGGVAGPVDPEADLPRLAASRALLEQIDALAPRLADMSAWSGLATDEEAMEKLCALAERLRQGMASQAHDADALRALRQVASTLVVDANDMLAPEGAVASALTMSRQAAARFDEAAAHFEKLAEAPSGADFDMLRARADGVSAHASRLNAWTHWRRAREEGISMGLAPLVQAVEQGSIAPKASIEAFEVGYARWFAADRIDQEPLLRHFMAGEHTDRIDRFRALEDTLAALAVRYIRARLCGLIPIKEDVGKKDGYGVLKHQLQLQRAHMPVRRLAAEMGDAFTRLAPCMLMSPLSIAQYLPPEQALFDLVIFDEASQITPWDAIGAMARGKQVVIAGDPRQMPPTSFFSRGPAATDDGDGTEPDLESILDECLAAGVPQHSLDWHYRSRHESLIAFSNHRYYDSKLVTFPAPVTRASAVTWRKVDGVYARGAGRTNAIEAQALVDEAVSRLRDPGFVDAKGRPLTLGIITLNADQQKLVEDLLDKARRRFPEIEPHFGEDRTEPVVVKNLETVQGDERDLILLGIGFGPTEPAGKTMSMSFGALNGQGGWRRLNVAATRARAEMMIFTSFEPGMIDLTRTSARAVADLKHFIEYAERGPRALAEAVHGSQGGPDSPFEEAVAWELRRRGWDVVPQVGVSKFRIDLGVVHPDRPGDYLVGVECDGATYHSAATARDRDKVRAAILESLGWRLLRIWSTDWWIDKQGAADRLHLRITQTLAEARAFDEARAAASTALTVEAAAGTPGVDIAAAEIPATDAGMTPLSGAIPANLSVSIEASAFDPELDVVDEPLSGRLMSPPLALGAEAAASAALYRVTDFQAHAEAIDPLAFYDAAYDEMLSGLVRHVLASEAPITETLLVQRIARAHGFQRAGRLIRDRVMSFAERHHHVAGDGGAEPFVWSDSQAASTWSTARFPATEKDIRQIEEISLAELRAAGGGGDVVEIARQFSIRRLTAMARVRLQRALGD